MIRSCDGWASSVSNSARVSSCACDFGWAEAAGGASAAWMRLAEAAPRAANSTRALRTIMGVSSLGSEFVVARLAVVADHGDGRLEFIARARGVLRDLGKRLRMRHEVLHQRVEL